MGIDRSELPQGITSRDRRWLRKVGAIYPESVKSDPMGLLALRDSGLVRPRDAIQEFLMPSHTEEVWDCWITGFNSTSQGVRFLRSFGIYDHVFHASQPISVLMSDAINVVLSANPDTPLLYAPTILHHPMAYAGMTDGPHHIGGPFKRLDRDGAWDAMSCYGVSHVVLPRIARVRVDNTPW
jgi:hypothetical protein